MRFKTLSLSVAVALIGLVHTVTAQSDDVLRWKLEKGQKFKIVSDNDAKTEVDTPMGVQKMPMKMTMTMEWEVVGADEGNFKVKQVLKRIQMSMDSPLGQIEIDTDEEEQEMEGPMAQMLSGMQDQIGEETMLEFNSRGVVKKSKKGDDEEEQGMMMMGNSSDIAGQTFFEFPKEAVSKDMKWSQKMENEVPGGEIVMDNKYAYSGVGESSMHEIKVEGEMSGGMAQMGQQMDIDEGSMKGTIFFDNKAGYLKKAEMEQEMVMLMDAGGMELTITTTSKSKTTFELQK